MSAHGRKKTSDPSLVRSEQGQDFGPLGEPEDWSDWFSEPEDLDDGDDADPAGSEGRRYLVDYKVGQKFDPIGEPERWSDWYLTEAQVAGVSCAHGEIIGEFKSVLKELARQRGWDRAYIGGHTFFAWIRRRPLARACPDVYLVDERPARRLPNSWRTWRRGQGAPRWALEVVSGTWRKDYLRSPPKYAQLGCRELVLFDPAALLEETKSTVRAPLTVKRAERGAKAMVTVYSGPGPAWSEELGCWVQPRREGYSARLGLSHDEANRRRIVPLEQARREEAEHAREQAERAREQAEKRVRELEAELAARRDEHD